MIAAEQGEAAASPAAMTPNDALFEARRIAPPHIEWTRLECLIFKTIWQAGAKGNWVTFLQDDIADAAHVTQNGVSGAVRRLMKAGIIDITQHRKNASRNAYRLTERYRLQSEDPMSLHKGYERRIIHDPVKKASATFAMVTCTKCPAEGGKQLGRMKYSSEGTDERVLAQHLRAQGWDIDNHLKRPLCPKCAAPRFKPGQDTMLRVVMPPEPEMPATRPALRHSEQLLGSASGFMPRTPIIIDHEPQQETTMPVALVSPEPPTAEAPRKPTVDQRRRINDALDDAYDQKAKGYSAGKSDETIAKTLDVPRAWVAEIREMFHGPEGNAAVAALVTEIELMKRDLGEVERSIETAMEKADTLKKRIDAWEAKLRTAMPK